MKGWRSLMFVAADDERRIAGAAAKVADGLILDLEDAVAAGAKDAARAALAGARDGLAPGKADVLVRINAPWRLATADLEAAVISGIDAIVAPKVEDAARLGVLDEMISALETERGLPPGGIGLVALIESPRALGRLPEMAACPRVRALALGSEDFALALGTPPTPENLDLPCRMIALAAAAEGVVALGSPVSISDFRDVDAWRRGALAGKAIGMSGALCIHPDQARVLNEVHTPAPADLEEARRIIAAFERSDRGVTVIDGRMIDAPVVARARRLLAWGVDA